MRNEVLAWLCVLGLAGCALQPKKLGDLLAPASGLGDQIECAEPCVTEWQRAQLWLAKHSRWRISTATDVVIDTHNVPRNEPSYGFSVIKEPFGNGAYSIRMRLVCGNPIGCDLTADEVRKAFYYYVKTGVDLFQHQQNLFSIY